MHSNTKLTTKRVPNRFIFLLAIFLVCLCKHQFQDITPKLVIFVFTGDYLDVEQVKEEAIKVIDETHNLFKDDPIQGLVPRLPSNKLIPYGPFQIWFHKVEEIIKVNQFP